MLKPSDFAKIDPMGSVFHKSEYEQIAMNIMMILKRTGNVFRELSWEEYTIERGKDKDFSNTEMKYFDEVVKYCRSAETAILFSGSWDI